MKLDDISETDIEEIDADRIQEEDIWRVGIIKEMTDIKFGQLDIEGFSEDECEAILNFACTS